MLLMGESINGTRKQVAEAIQARDAEFIKNLALEKVEAGAGLLEKIFCLGETGKRLACSARIFGGLWALPMLSH